MSLCTACVAKHHLHHLINLHQSPVFVSWEKNLGVVKEWDLSTTNTHHHHLKLAMCFNHFHFAAKLVVMGQSERPVINDCLVPSWLWCLLGDDDVDGVTITGMRIVDVPNRPRQYVNSITPLGEWWWWWCCRCTILRTQQRQCHSVLFSPLSPPPPSGSIVVEMHSAWSITLLFLPPLWFVSLSWWVVWCVVCLYRLKLNYQQTNGW